MGVVSGAISFERQRGREVAFDRRTVDDRSYADRM